MNYPKITIVTPSYNQGNFLEKTIRSVLDQNYPNLEYIIIDGGSTDHSVEIIKRYEKHLTYWVSEKDKGQSHAINKGLARYTGDIFNWLCSDDYLEAGSLMYIAEAFLSDKNIHCYSGKLRQFSSSGTVGYYGNMLMPSWEDTLRLRVLKQPSVFFSRTAIDKMGPLNEGLHYSMDADWLYRFLFLFGQENILEDDFLVAHYFLHDGSKTGSQIPGFIKEGDSMMHFFATHIKQQQYTSLLERKEINKTYVFPESILKAADRNTLEHMVFFYLLRKATKIYAESDFDFAKRFLALDNSRIDLKQDELQMIDFLKKYVESSSWLFFKIRRAYLWYIKRKHLSLDHFTA